MDFQLKSLTLAHRYAYAKPGILKLSAQAQNTCNRRKSFFPFTLAKELTQIHECQCRQHTYRIKLSTYSGEKLKKRNYVLSVSLFTYERKLDCFSIEKLCAYKCDRCTKNVCYFNCNIILSLKFHLKSFYCCYFSSPASSLSLCILCLDYFTLWNIVNGVYLFDKTFWKVVGNSERNYFKQWSISFIIVFAHYLIDFHM